MPDKLDAPPRDYVAAMWHLYWHVFYAVPRKVTLRRMIACGLSAREALEEMRTHERSREG